MLGVPASSGERMLLGAPSPQSGCWGPSSSRAGRQIYRHTSPRVPPHRLALPAPTGSTLASSVTPCPLLGPACLFCHGVRVQAFSFPW